MSLAAINGAALSQHFLFFLGRESKGIISVIIVCLSGPVEGDRASVSWMVSLDPWVLRRGRMEPYEEDYLASGLRGCYIHPIAPFLIKTPN